MKKFNPHRATAEHFRAIGPSGHTTDIRHRTGEAAARAALRLHGKRATAKNLEEAHTLYVIRKVHARGE